MDISNPWQRRGKKAKGNYLAGYQSLYGEKPTPAPARPAEGVQIELIKKPKKKNGKLPAPHEHQEQIRLAYWLKKNQILFFHIPNGGYRDIREASKFKAMGVQAGIPDLCIPYARKGHHGLWIELKRVSGGVLSDSQRFWMAELTKNGYLCVVAKGAEMAIECVKNYLSYDHQPLERIA